MAAIVPPSGRLGARDEARPTRVTSGHEGRQTTTLPPYRQPLGANLTLRGGGRWVGPVALAYDLDDDDDGRVRGRGRRLAATRKSSGAGMSGLGEGDHGGELDVYRSEQQRGGGGDGV